MSTINIKMVEELLADITNISNKMIGKEITKETLDDYCKLCFNCIGNSMKNIYDKKDRIYLKSNYELIIRSITEDIDEITNKFGYLDKTTHSVKCLIKLLNNKYSSSIPGLSINYRYLGANLTSLAVDLLIDNHKVKYDANYDWHYYETTSDSKLKSNGVLTGIDMSKSSLDKSSGVILYRARKNITIKYGGLESKVNMPGWYSLDGTIGKYTFEDMKVSDEALADLKNKLRVNS